MSVWWCESERWPAVQRRERAALGHRGATAASDRPFSKCHGLPRGLPPSGTFMAGETPCAWVALDYISFSIRNSKRAARCVRQKGKERKKEKGRLIDR